MNCMLNQTKMAQITPSLHILQILRMVYKVKRTLLLENIFRFLDCSSRFILERNQLKNPKVPFYAFESLSVHSSNSESLETDI